MGKYANLNEIVHYYKVYKENSGLELILLKRRLLNIPVILKEFEEELGNGGFREIDTRAEFYNPQMRIGLLDDLVSHDEADELTERMILPYPIIYLNGEVLSNNFHKLYRNEFELIVPDERDKTARVLHIPYKNVSGSLAIIYERKKPGVKRYLHYIEMRLTKDKL